MVTKAESESVGVRSVDPGTIAKPGSSQPLTPFTTRTGMTKKPVSPPPTSSPYIEVLESRIHNRGVFARTIIPAGKRIIEYVGERVTKIEGQRRAEAAIERAEEDSGKGFVYVFELNKRYDIDGDVDWNTARWINHSCEPNCEALTLNGRIWIVALTDIDPGEELSYNYGYDIAVCEDHPCRCGADGCVGFIVAAEFHDAVLEMQANRLLPAEDFLPAED